MTDELLDDVLNKTFVNSLFLVVTYYEGEFELDIDPDQYEYIFLIDVADPPDYAVQKWSVLAEYFKEYRDKVFCIGPESTLYPFSLLPINWCFVWYAKHLQEHIPVTARYLEKKYVCMNGAHHKHRLEMLNALKHRGLLKHGHYSLYQKHSLPSEETPTASRALYGTIADENHNHFPPELFSTPINIVTETTISNQMVFLTEKTVRAIYAKQLMFHLGNPYSLKYLTNQFNLRPILFGERDFERNYSAKIDTFCDYIDTFSLNKLGMIYNSHADDLAENRHILKTQSMELALNNFLTYCDKYHIIRM